MARPENNVYYFEKKKRMKFHVYKKIKNIIRELNRICGFEKKKKKNEKFLSNTVVELCSM